MVTVNTGIIGVTAGGNRDFATNTALWAGGTGTYNGAAEFQPASGGVVEAYACTILGRYGEPDAITTIPLWIFENGIFNLADGSATEADPAPINLIWNDITVTKGSSGYIPFGAWSANSAGSVPQLNNVRFWGGCTPASFEVGLSPFFGGAGTTATVDGNTVNAAFNNLSYWNGEPLSSGAIRGASPQLPSIAAHGSPLFGPFGTNLNNSGNRSIIRFSNQGTGVANANNFNNHAGLTTNLDIRALGQVTSTLQFYIGGDSGVHMRHLNMLVGQISGTGDTVFARQFDDGAKQEMFVGTNPVKSRVGPRLITVADADIVAAQFWSNTIPYSDGEAAEFEGIIYTANNNLTGGGAPSGNPGGWTVTTDNARGVILLGADDYDVFDTNWTFANGEGFTDQVVFDETEMVNGLLWRQFSYTGTANGSNTIAAASRLSIPALTNETYRVYDWFEQPGNDTWGTEITVSVPPVNATDEQVATARAGGFDIHNGAQWDTQTVVEFPDDDAVLFTGFTTAAAATVGLSAVNAITSGSHLPVVTKARAYTVQESTNVHFNLPYTMTGTEATFVVPIVLDGTATVFSGATTLTFPATTDGIAADTGVTKVNSTGSVTLANGAMLGTANTLEFEATTDLDLNSTSPVGTFTGATISNLPATIADGSVFVGTYTETVADQTLVVTNPVDVAGLILATSGDGTLAVSGARRTDFGGTSGDITFVFDITIDDNATTTDGLLSVYLNDTLQVAGTTAISNPVDDDVIDVVYTEPGRTDFLLRHTVVALNGAQTLTVVNATNPYPNIGADNSALDGLFTINTPFGNGTANIVVSSDQTSETDVNTALNEQVKGTINYNALIQEAQLTDIIGSDGISSVAFAIGANITFTSSSPYSIGYVRETSGDQSLLASTSTLNIVGGGTVDVGVTILPPSAFDPAITQAQVDAAATRIIDEVNTNTDDEANTILVGIEVVNETIIDVNSV